jgi:aminomethyltransferase
VHRLGPEHFFLCVNASNTSKDFDWIRAQNSDFDAEVLNSSDQYTQLAIQGPKALEILQPLVDVELGAIKYYWFKIGHVDRVPAIIARTGYTGEDGFEIYFDPNESERVWNAIMNAGRANGILPCGLAARNTLRLEAKMALYGNDIDQTTTVLEADLGWIVKLNKGDFIGRDQLARQKEEGLARKLIGFEMVETRYRTRPLSGLCRWRGGRLCNVRKSGSFSRKEHRAGISSCLTHENRTAV